MISCAASPMRPTSPRPSSCLDPTKALTSWRLQPRQEQPAEANPAPVNTRGRAGNSGKYGRNCQLSPAGRARMRCMPSTRSKRVLPSSINPTPRSLEKGRSASAAALGSFPGRHHHSRIHVEGTRRHRASEGPRPPAPFEGRIWRLPDVWAPRSGRAYRRAPFDWLSPTARSRLGHGVGTAKRWFAVVVALADEPGWRLTSAERMCSSNAHA